MKSIFLLMILLVGSITSCYCQDVKAVEDKYKNHQMKSMEFIQWKFRPKWYYNLFHKKYMKKYTKNIKYEAPMAVAIENTQKEAGETQEKVRIVYEEERNKFLDRTIDYEYLLTKNDRENLLKTIESNLTTYIQNGGEQRHVDVLNQEVDRIKKNIEIIHKSHLANSKKREAYLSYFNELQKVNSLAIRISQFTKLNAIPQ